MGLNLLLLVVGLVICFGGIYIRKVCSAILGLIWGALCSFAVILMTVGLWGIDDETFIIVAVCAIACALISVIYDKLCAAINAFLLEMSRNVQSGNTQNLKSTVIQRSFPKWSVAERRKTAAASDQAAVCACAHSRYFAGGSPSGLRV